MGGEAPTQTEGGYGGGALSSHPSTPASPGCASRTSRLATTSRLPSERHPCTEALTACSCPQCPLFGLFSLKCHINHLTQYAKAFTVSCFLWLCLLIRFAKPYTCFRKQV